MSYSNTTLGVHLVHARADQLLVPDVRDQEVLSSLVRQLTVKVEEGFYKMGVSCCKRP